MIKLWIEQGATGQVRGDSGPLPWQPLPPGVNPIYAIAVSPEGRQVAAGRANQIFIYDVETEQLVTRLTDPNLTVPATDKPDGPPLRRPGTAHLDLVQSLAFNPRGDRLASGGFRTIKIWRRQPIAPPTELTGRDSATTLDASASHTAVGQTDGGISIYDNNSSQVIQSWSGHDHPVLAVALNDAGTQVASVSDDTVKLWSLQDGATLGTIRVSSYPRALAYVSQDSRIAVTGSDGKIHIWALPQSAKDPDQAAPLLMLEGHVGEVNALDTAMKGAQLISGGNDGSVRLWQVSDGKSLRTIQHGSPVTAVAVTTDGKRVASTGIDGSAKLFNAADGKLISHLEGGEESGQKRQRLQRRLALAKRYVANAKSDHKATTDRKKQEEANVKKGEEGLKKAEEEAKKKTEAATKAAESRDAARKKLEESKKALANAENSKNEAAEKASAASEKEKPSAEEAVKKAGQALADAKKSVEETEKALAKAEEEFKKSVEAKKAAERALQTTTEALGRDRKTLEKANQRVTEAEAVVKQQEDLLKQRETDANEQENAQQAKDKELAGLVQQLNDAHKKAAEAQTELRAKEKHHAEVDLLLTQLIDKVKSTNLEVGKSITVFRKARAKVQESIKKHNTRIRAISERIAIMNEIRGALDPVLDEARAKDNAAAQEVAAQLRSKMDALQAATAAQRRAEQAELLAAQRQLLSAESDYHAARIEGSNVIEKIDLAAKQAFDRKIAATDELSALRKQVGEVTSSYRTERQALAHVSRPWHAVTFSADDAQLVTCGSDGWLRRWSAESGRLVQRIAGSARAVAFAGQSRIVAIHEKEALVVWITEPQWELERVIGSPDVPDLIVDRVTALHFGPDGKQLASGSGQPSRSGELKIWNVETGSLVSTIPDAHSDSIFSVEFGPKGKYLASCGADRFMKVFDATTGKHLKSFEGHTHHVLGVSWRADGRMLATGGADNVIKLWDFRTGEQRRTIGGFGKEVTAVQFVAVSDNIVASSGDKTVRTKTTKGKDGPSFGGAKDFVYAVRASTDGKTIAAGGQDSVVRVWDSEGKAIADFPPPPQPDADKHAAN